MSYGACLIWGTPCQIHRLDIDTWMVTGSARAGGDYLIDDIVHMGMALSDAEKARLTSWLCEQRMVGNTCPKITSDEIEYVKARKPLQVQERADRLLRCLAEHSDGVGVILGIVSSDENSSLVTSLGLPEPDQDIYELYRFALAWSESVDDKELSFLTNFLSNQGWITKDQRIKTDQGIYQAPGYSQVSYLCRVEISGYSRIEEVAINVLSDQCFVAMWFDPIMEKAYDEGIRPAVESAGYAPVRIDQKPDLIGKIDDAIIAEIRRSRFVIADFTHGDKGVRGGVYYEAGFAHGLNLPVFFTCHKDTVDELHFDTRQFNHIVWENYDDLRENLCNRILAYMGEGPNI